KSNKMYVKDIVTTKCYTIEPVCSPMENGTAAFTLSRFGRPLDFARWVSVFALRSEFGKAYCIGYCLRQKAGGFRRHRATSASAFSPNWSCYQHLAVMFAVWLLFHS